MRIDDLRLLRIIDELEETEPASLMNGIGLLQKAAGSEIRWGFDEAPFASELLLAYEAGLVTWERQSLGTHSDHRHQANNWLQEVRDIRLTIVGRDRARGRVIQRPLPDPDEDDERPIAGMTLEEVARAIGATYTGSQLPRYLRDSPIPDELIPPEVSGSKWEYVFAVLDGMHEGGSAARRALREFLGQWLDGRLHLPPSPELRERIVGELAAQGWYVREGRLVIGERSADPAHDLTPRDQQARLAALHPDVREAAGRYLSSGHAEVAIFEAFKAVSHRVNKLSGLDLDGSDLANEAFSEQRPRIILADLDTETGRNIQAGFRFLFMGAIRGLRNPDAHELFQPLDSDEALERLGLASLLMRWLDRAEETANN
jgi:uncharacterized protein (TIGR02391 family)